MSENTLPSVQEIQAMTRKQLVNLTPATIRFIMRDGERAAAFAAIVNSAEGQAAVQEVINEVSQPVVPDLTVTPPTEDELAEAAIKSADADRAAEEARVAEENRRAVALQADAEVAAYAQAGITITKDAAGNIIKIVKKYQAHDENKQPIGHPTHLEAKSWPELSMKQEAAHENALRLAERIKKQKVTFKTPEQSVLEPLTDDQIREYIKIFESEPAPKFDASGNLLVPGSAKYHEVLNVLEQNKLGQAQVREKMAKDSMVTTQWMRSHLHDFAPNTANASLLGDYLRDNNLDYTTDNLDLAFSVLQSQLTPVQPTYASTESLENETPEAPVVAVPVAPPAPVQAPQPVAAAPVASAPVIQQAPTRRPGVNGGIAPGTLTASRPVAQATNGLTKKDIKDMKPEEMRRRMRVEPGFAEELARVANAKS